MGSDSVVSERALREVYLKGFEIAVRQSQPMSIMTSYNLINGVHAANNYDLKHASGYDTTYGLHFAADAVSQCTTAAADFTVYYSGYCTNFKYNAEKKCYNAYISGEEYIDGTDNTSIDLANVIVLNIPTKTIDNYGRQAMELTGSGSGYFFTGGKYVEINWTRADRADNFHYTLKDGTPLNLSVGKTFISIAPLDNTKGLVFNG